MNEEKSKSNRVYLTIEGAVPFINSIGINATLRQVRRWADVKVLPFFDWQGKRHISTEAILTHFSRVQAAAESDALRQLKRTRRQPEPPKPADEHDQPVN